jgi:rare lipoprotein A
MKLNSSIILKLLLIILTGAIVSGCKTNSHSFRSLSKEDKHQTKYRGHYKVGTKYKIKGKTYKPYPVSRYNKVGMASWYGSRYGFHGKKTANGDIYNKNLLTAAHKTLPMPSLVKVTNLKNGKSLIVMVNDRGPYTKNREIDVSEKAAALLGFRKAGTAKVRVQYLHSETQKFLTAMGIKRKEGARAKKSLTNSKCTVNCHVKLVNLKYGYGRS